MLFNNQIYGLTKGQYSPTSQVGKVTPSSPLGSIDQPIVPARFALGARATFVARTLRHLEEGSPKRLRAARQHKGASFIEILQNCPVFNDGIFDLITDRKTGPAYQLWLENGQPMKFGANGEKGLRLNPQTLTPRGRDGRRRRRHRGRYRRFTTRPTRRSHGCSPTYPRSWRLA